MDYSFAFFFLFFFVGLIAGIIDTIAGGGGLISLTSLMFTGIPPDVAIATNKLGSCGGSFSSTLHFFRKGKLKFKESYLLVIFTFIGAILGAFLLTKLNVNFLSKLIPILLFSIIVFNLLNPKLGSYTKKKIIPQSIFIVFICPLLGFYDGIFGPGVGTFYAISFVLLQGFNLIDATVQAKLLNFTSNIAALLFFIFSVNIDYKLGLVILLGQLLGGNVGARMVIKNGYKLIKVVMIIVSLLITMKLLFF